MAVELLYANDFTEELESTWEIIREVPDAYCVKDNALTIHTLPGTLWMAANNAHNIFLRPVMPEKEGLTMQITVTNAPKEQGEQAGLTWFVDEDNYVKLIKENLGGEVFIVMAREEAGEAGLVEKYPFAGPTAMIRMTLCEGKVVGQVFVGNAWETIGTCDPVPGGKVQPGVYSHGGPEGEKHLAKLENYRLYVK